MSWDVVDEVLNHTGDKYELLCNIGTDKFTAEEIRYLGLKLFNMPFRSGQTKQELMNELKGSILQKGHWDSMDEAFGRRSLKIQNQE